MAVERSIDVEATQAELGRVVRYGAQAPQLIKHGRALVDILVPPDDDPQATLPVRAITAECMIRQAIGRLDHTATREALLIILGLQNEGILPKLGARREQAADLFDRHPRTFKDTIEPELLWHLASALYRMQQDHDEPHNDEEPAEGRT